MNQVTLHQYNKSGIQSVLSHLEKRQPCELEINGWRAVAAYKMLNHFANLENKKGGFLSATCSFFYGLPMPSLGLIAINSRLQRFSMSINRNENATRITLRPKQPA